MPYPLSGHAYSGKTDHWGKWSGNGKEKIGLEVEALRGAPAPHTQQLPAAVQRIRGHYFGGRVGPLTQDDYVVGP
jgi:hypothetical protein